MMDFDQLIAEVCRSVGIDDVDATTSSTVDAVSTARFRINDCDFSVSHAPFRPGRIFLQCDFGVIPEHREALVLRKLLQANYLMYVGNSPAFSVHPQFGHVLLCVEEELKTITPPQLIQSMELLAQHAHDWRRGYFLDAETAMESASFSASLRV
jgi:hypothetical protein